MLIGKARRLIVRIIDRSSNFVVAHLPGYRRALYTSGDEQYFLKLVNAYYGNSFPSCVKVIMDIGANIGQSAATLLRLFPDSQVYSVEPASEVFRKLSSTFEGNKRLTPLHYAVSNQDGVTTLYHSEFSVASSLDSPWKATGTSESVMSKRIDTMCRDLNVDRINICKIDTEGHDLMVLRGAEEMLAKGAVDILVVECGFKPGDACHSDFYEIADYLKRFDFNVAGFTEAYNFEWNEKFSLLYCNAIFARSPQ